MKRKYLSFLLSLLPLVSCSQKGTFILSDTLYGCFDTFIDIRLYEGSNENITDIRNIFRKYDEYSDNYKAREVTNIYSINHTNENVEVDPDLYNLLHTTFEVSSELTCFSPMLGSLNKLWKEALNNKQVLSETTINEELEKIANSDFTFVGNNIVNRSGLAELDLGGIAKGYSLDIVKTYLKGKGITKYLVNAGRSSILLGEKDGGDDFVVSLSELPGKSIRVKNTTISTSGVSEQSVTIEGKKYSHIINPLNGSAEAVFYDAVIVLTESSYLGDALSTAMMNSTTDEIKELETTYNAKVITIKNQQIVYKNEGIILY